MQKLSIILITMSLILFSAFQAGARPAIKVMTGSGKNAVIRDIPLEDYVAGVVNGELPKGWPIEAIKAQAVAARTYAVAMIEEAKRSGTKNNYDVTATTDDQVYNSSRSSSITKEAVEGTIGEVLTLHDKPIKARFHSSCGGKTETSIRVWGENDISKSIDDPYCKDSPHNSWKVTLASLEISKRLLRHRIDTGMILDISPESFEGTGRVAAVMIKGSKQTLSLTGNDFRRYLGFNLIKSTLFTVEKTANGFTFKGSGFGHGVGMCQWGARGMALAGKTYKEILRFYYPGTTFTKTD